MNDNKPKILALETSGGVGSVALGYGSQVIAEQKFTAKHQYAAHLLPTIDSLCRSQGWSPGEIEHVAVSAGPGSFTGLRIAITVAKAIAYANRIPIIAVPSTDVLAMNALEAEKNEGFDIRHLAVVLDAKRKQVYAGGFERVYQGEVEKTGFARFVEKNEETADFKSHPYGMILEDRFLPGFRHVIGPCAIRCEQLLAELPRPLYVLGEGLAVHKEALSGPEIVHLDEPYWPGRASQVLRCGRLMAQAGCFADPDRLLPFYIRRPEAVERWEKLHGKDKL